MAANSSIILTNLDFDTLKNTFKAYLKSQDRFNDYDFEGSNMNVLLDILSYNTYHNAFYLNMIGNEMFLDSAQLRDSVVSHAKELNYTPRSFTSAVANVNLTIVSSNPLKRSIVIPKGTTFTSNFASTTYTFSTAETVVVSDFTLNSAGTQVTFIGNNVSLYEGYFLSDTFTYNIASPPRMTISNRNVDISSIAVTVIEDVGATSLTYTRATSLFDLTSTSQVFFVQGGEGNSYEIIFGDGVTGRRPKDNSIVNIEYRVSNGELPNGCNTFKPDSQLDGESNVSVYVNTVAAGGSISESTESIKYNAPRHFTTQERAITTEDYETLLKLNFPEINAVTAYGGENLNPPQFGKVFVAVDLNEVDYVPTVKRDEYYRFLKPRSPVSIDPVFVDPEYTYLGVTSTIRYNVNVTRLTLDDVKTITTSAITKYAQDNLNNFNRILRYSKLIHAIDNSQQSIISNETEISVIKKLNPELGKFLTFDVSYNIPLNSLISSCISSSFIMYKGIKAYIEDDAKGNLVVISAITNAVIDTVGKVNYDTGLLQFSNFKIDSYFNNSIKFSAIPRYKDISTINNVILNIVEEDIKITVEPVRS